MTRRLRPLLGLTIALAAIATILITAVPAVSFAYRSESLHASIETTATVVGLLAALLVDPRVGPLSSQPAARASPPGRFRDGAVHERHGANGARSS